jgi:hypothetical protein
MLNGFPSPFVEVWELPNETVALGPPVSCANGWCLGRRQPSGPEAASGVSGRPLPGYTCLHVWREECLRVPFTFALHSPAGDL